MTDPSAAAATLDVAVVQLTADTDAGVNTTTAVAGIEGADGTDLVLLPEYTSGWAADLTTDLVQDPRGEFTRAVSAAAARTGRTVVLGTMEPADDGGADRAVNVALALDADGEPLGRYRKVHLFDAYGIRESDALSPGPAGAEHALVFDAGPMRVGVATCYDLRFPESFRVLVDAGADVLVVGAAWAAGEGKADLLRTLARARAIENTCYVLLASQHGRGRSGHSVIIDPRGVVLAEADGEGPATLTASLSPEVVVQARAQVPSLEHRRYRVVPR